MRTPLVFLGVNYYFPAQVAHDDAGDVVRTRDVPIEDVPRTAMGWPVDPSGLEDVLVRVTEDYGPAEIIVTENGSAFEDHVGPDGSVDDPHRAAYLESHLAALARAVDRGAPVTGYYAWSLLDNFEWAYGYDKRFGLVRVDYETQQRTIKASGRRYAGIAGAARLVAR